MVGTVADLERPLWLSGRSGEVGDSPRNDDLFEVAPNDSETRPNRCLIVNEEHGALSYSDRAGPIGTFQEKTTDVQTEFMANPMQDNDSGGVICKIRGTQTYAGSAIFARLDFVEASGEDPAATMIPRRTYVTGLAPQDPGGTQVKVGVSGDLGETRQIDSTSVEFTQELARYDCWWDNQEGIEGERLSFAVSIETSERIVFEGITSEFRVRGRR